MWFEESDVTGHIGISCEKLLLLTSKGFYCDGIEGWVSVPPWSISSSPPQKVCPPRPHRLRSPSAGNQGQRFFPHTGYLGLTPIRVEGSE